MGTRVRVVSALVEGVSLRATVRLTEVSRPAVTDLLLRVGEGCRCVLDATMRDLHCDALELDEVWSFVGCKEGHLIEGLHPPEYGDQYTWVALDARTRLVPVHRVAKRTPAAALAFAQELRARVLGAPQITTDGHKPYLEAIEQAFGRKVHYAQILKTYHADEAGGASRDDVRYSRGRVVRSVSVPLRSPALMPGIIREKEVPTGRVSPRSNVSAGGGELTSSPATWSATVAANTGGTALPTCRNCSSNDPVSP